jgi:MoaA/NifB/PqqE/SkfB family radical SAM enzyme
LDCALTFETPRGTDQSSAPAAQPKQELTSEEWQSVLKKAWEAGVPHIVFTGVEPTRRPDLCDLIRCAQKLGQVTGLISDGLRLNDPAFLTKILQSGLDHLTLLFQPELPDSWKALEACVQANLFTVVHLSLFRETVDQVTDNLDRLSQMNIHAISLSTDDPSLARSLHAVRDRSAALGLKLVWDVAVPYGRFNPVALETETSEAGAGRAWLYVEADGEVFPGQGIPHPLGNLLRDPWATIWQKAREFSA